MRALRVDRDWLRGPGRAIAGAIGGAGAIALQGRSQAQAKSLVDQLLIHRFIAIDHASHPKVDGHMVAAVLTANGRNLSHRLNAVLNGVAEKPGVAIHHDLGGGAHRHRNDRGAAGHRFWHD